MPLQILRFELDGITAGDYLTWCRDPDPLALDFGLRSMSIDADALGDTITATLDWSPPPPPAPAAATAAGLPLTAGVQVRQLPTDRAHSRPVATGTGPPLRRAAAAVMRGAGIDAESRLPCRTGVEGQLRTAA